MAVPAFMRISGTTQGPITKGASSSDSIGNHAVEDHVDECRILEIKHNVFKPADPHSGQPTGQRVHEPLIVTKLMDKASPLLYNALASGETLTEVEMKFYRTSAAGSLEHYATWLLNSAIIVGMRAVMPNILDRSFEQYGQLEEVSFSYAAITWSQIVAGTEATDTFRQQQN